MLAVLHSLEMFVVDLFKSRCQLEAENLFLRHQLSCRLEACACSLWSAVFGLGAFPMKVARHEQVGASIRGLVRRETGFFVQASASDKMPTHRKN